MRRQWNLMITLKQKVLALVVMAMVSVGAFGQREGKKPPKNTNTKVVVQEKGKPPKGNQDRPKNDGKKGRP
jgi:hypothetical protein